MGRRELGRAVAMVALWEAKKEETKVVFSEMVDVLERG